MTKLYPASTRIICNGIALYVPRLVTACGAEKWRGAPMFATALAALTAARGERDTRAWRASAPVVSARDVPAESALVWASIFMARFESRAAKATRHAARVTVNAAIRAAYIFQERALSECAESNRREDRTACGILPAALVNTVDANGNLRAA